MRAGEAGIRELSPAPPRRAAAEGASLTVLNGVVGAAGLRATMATLEAGATLALANKESMVAGGPFVLDAARRSGSPILRSTASTARCSSASPPEGGQARLRRRRRGAPARRSRRWRSCC